MFGIKADVVYLIGVVSFLVVVAIVLFLMAYNYDKSKK